ncbi:hypothetical protein MAR_033364 [Mya arenaria]|uniref:Myb/SANT-like DNA-binding domain-containing protein n=1 Tax=Mya arenaria TaxID=6604 RepID=A0ABY7GBU8_MYAAR|nr:hypothetical protein MAR_033364 [Mya arenaria]
MTPLKLMYPDSVFDTKVVQSRGGIASETKDLWIKINDAYNEDSHHPRTAAELTKKWDNLVQTHRAKYSQYKRELGRTGSGTNPVKLSEVTERVMAVVGENSPNIVGLCSGLDSTILQMQSSNCSAVETPSQPSHTIELYEEPLQPVQDISTSYIVNCSGSSSSNNTNNNGCSHCSTCMEIMALKKRKLQLEVQLLEKKT